MAYPAILEDVSRSAPGTEIPGASACAGRDEPGVGRQLVRPSIATPTAQSLRRSESRAHSATDSCVNPNEA
jgi:hypothetical protein